MLDVLAIRESQHLDTGQAIAVLLITLAALFGLVLIIVILFAIIAAIAASCDRLRHQLSPSLSLSLLSGQQATIMHMYTKAESTCHVWTRMLMNSEKIATEY